VVLPLLGAVRVAEGIVPTRASREPHQVGGLVLREVAGRLPEVELGRRLNAVGPIAERDPIEPQRQDVFFRPTQLQPERKVHLQELVANCPRGILEQDPRDLHRDRRSTTHDAPVDEVAPKGPPDRKGVDSRMGVEALILGGNEGIDDALRKRAYRHGLPAPLGLRFPKQDSVLGRDLKIGLGCLQGRGGGKGPHQREEADDESHAGRPPDGIGARAVWNHCASRTAGR
jgi:hypothetical protein